MIGLILGIKEQVRREFDLSPVDEYFYRYEHAVGGCKPCKRFYELFDACQLRMSRDAVTTGESNV